MPDLIELPDEIFEPKDRHPVNTLADGVCGNHKTPETTVVSGVFSLTTSIVFSQTCINDAEGPRIRSFESTDTITVAALTSSQIDRQPDRR